MTALVSTSPPAPWVYPYLSFVILPSLAESPHGDLSPMGYLLPAWAGSPCEGLFPWGSMVLLLGSQGTWPDSSALYRQVATFRP